ncbi:Allantoicase [Lophiostoma macrostomum CBS 122681]|uniref:allantoicase n=1 Tax=Lophiostoma macrostomum CBS 122681 TaxID=1314788 RepID=A0A6A6T7R0_9PLEO|nr:Allantoicase [Lophiostoma macrostomum CBS 122681]
MEIHTHSPEDLKHVATSNSSTQARAIPIDQIDSTFKSQYTDLISTPLGSRILAFSDEWFAAASNLITPTPPIRRPGVFTHAGAWYDGWETRRHNTEPADWVVIQLGVASGRVAGVEIDTAFFNGNHAPEIAVEGAFITSAAEEEEVKKAGYTGWETILGIQECGPSQRHGWLLEKLTEKAYTHVRLLMYPDGGIARFRLYGNAVPVFPQSVDEVFELSATVMGGVATSCSDQHFGTKDNLLLPGRGKDMGDGWETKRTRGEHVDWTIVRLGAKGEIDHIVVDTAHFRGNFPQKVQVFAGEFASDPKHDDGGWVEVLEPQKSGPDKEHEYKGELKDVEGKAYTHAKLVIIPDGGVKRFRVFGKRV